MCCVSSEGETDGMFSLDADSIIFCLSSSPLFTETTSSSHQLPVHNNFDGLDKAFVLFRLPPKPGSATKRLHRRVDLISSPKRTYALAVLGWSGSMIFERDLR